MSANGVCVYMCWGSLRLQEYWQLQVEVQFLMKDEYGERDSGLCVCVVACVPLCVPMHQKRGS